MKKLQVIGSLLALFFITGCTVKTPKYLIPKMQKPQQEVAENDTKFSVSLQKIGDMLEEIGDPDIYIFIDAITNETTGSGKVPNDIEGMLKTAFLNMGYKVHVVSNHNLLIGKDEAYIIQGEISEFDVIRSENAGADLGLYYEGKNSDSDASAESDYGYQEIKIGLDFRVLNAKTGEYAPFVFAKNKIIIRRLSDSNKVGFSIAGNGFGLSGSVQVQNGVHESLRILSEVSSVELLGKLRMLPYWLTIPGGIPDKQVMNNYKRKFRALPPVQKRGYVYYLLNKFYSNLTQQNFDRYIIRFKKTYSLYPPNSDITPELFEKLLVELPKNEAKNSVRRRKENLLKAITE